MQVISRKEAREKGLKRYFTGKPCVRGHLSEKHTGNGSCCECGKIKSSSEEKREYDRKRYQVISEKRKKEASDWYYKNKERASRTVIKWRESNSDKVKAIRHNYKIRRRAKEAAGVSSAELGDWAKEQKKICYWCGVKCHKDYHIDHYKPLSKGGTHTLDNLVISCPTCNMRKSAKDPYEWAQQVGRLF